MKTIATLPLLLLLFVANGYAQKAKNKTGPVITENRSVESFHGIKVGGVFEITLVQGKSQQLTLEADKTIMGNIITEVKDGILHLRLNESVKRVKTLSAAITIEDLSMLDISGAANVHSSSLIKCDQLSLGISGAGRTDLQIEARSVVGDISGAGNCELAGSTYELRLVISGAGSFNAVDMKAQMVSIDVSGSGSARINTKNELKATVSGAGSVKYLGSPNMKEIDVSGAGSIRSIK